jgi:hypothetical protein
MALPKRHADLLKRLRERAARAHPRATAALIAAAEEELGFRLPPLLRAVYRFVGNGGFGPGHDWWECRERNRTSPRRTPSWNSTSGRCAAIETASRVIGGPRSWCRFATTGAAAAPAWTARGRRAGSCALIATPT